MCDVKARIVSCRPRGHAFKTVFYIQVQKNGYWVDVVRDCENGGVTILYFNYESDAIEFIRNSWDGSENQPFGIVQSYYCLRKND